MNENQTLLEFIDNDIKHYKEILICNRDDEHIQTYYTRRLKYYNKLKEVITIYNAIKIKPYRPLKEQDYTLEEIKQMWEEEGFEIISYSKERFEVYKQWIERHQKVSHYTSAKVVIEKDFYYIVGQFSNEYTQLLTKTLKTLEGKDAKNKKEI